MAFDKNKVAFVFPGGGSQYIGMGREYFERYAAARESFERVDRIAGFHLSLVMFGNAKGLTKEECERLLNVPENLTLSTFSANMAALSALESESGLEISDMAGFVAGHSLGEYSALCAAESVDVGTACYLLRGYGKAVGKCMDRKSGMAALVADRKTTEEIIRQSDIGGRMVCEISNENSPIQTVISGHTEAIMKVSELAKKYKINCIMINMPAAMHCSLMEEAGKAAEELLRKVDFKKPSVKWMPNEIAAPFIGDEDEIWKFLFSQVTKGVKWRQTMDFLKSNGVDTIVECGSKRVLSGIALLHGFKNVISLDNPKGITNLLNLMERGNTVTSRSFAVPAPAL